MKKFIIYFIVGFVLTHLIVSCEPKANIDLPNGVSSIILGLEQIDMYEGETRQIYASAVSSGVFFISNIENTH